MSAVQDLRKLDKERLTTVTEEKNTVQCETKRTKDLSRQSRPLYDVRKPEVELHRIELPQQHVFKEEEEQEEICSSEEKHLILKQEIDTFILTSACEENDHSEDETLNWSTEEEKPFIFHPVISSAVSGANSDQQDQKGELPQQHVFKEEEEQEEICSREEEKQLVLKQEIDTFILTSTCEENDHSEDENASWSTEEEKPLIVIYSDISEENGDQQLVSHSSHESVNGGKHRDPGSGRNAQPHEQSPHHMSSNDINNDVPTHCNTHTGEKSFKCDTCDKTFVHKRNLWRHLLTHGSEKQYTCKFCGKDFGRNDHLTIHVKIHTGEKPFTCKTCGKAFRCNNHMTIHMRTHTDEKPFICTICGKAFRRNSHLTIHLRAHTGEKPCTCKICGRGFSDASNLNMHMRIHTGEKPFPCKICGRAFRFKGDLKKHENRPPKRCIAAAQRFQMWPSECLN